MGFYFKQKFPRKNIFEFLARRPSQIAVRHISERGGARAKGNFSAGKITPVPSGNLVARRASN